MIESLNKKEWEGFCLDDLFKITSTSSGIDKCRLINLSAEIVEFGYSVLYKMSVVDKIQFAYLILW